MEDNPRSLADALDGGHRDGPKPATSALDAAQGAIDEPAAPGGERRALTIAVRYLRQIDLSIVGLYESVGSHAKPEGKRRGGPLPDDTACE
ncbi:MAG: hypothetical protein ACRDZQ_16125 [Acidimicrobiales bacterium]